MSPTHDPLIGPAYSLAMVGSKVTQQLRAMKEPHLAVQSGGSCSDQATTIHYDVGHHPPVMTVRWPPRQMTSHCLQGNFPSMAGV
mmetsp:Transcript_104676/g.180478  ORF Transcript_104676/g.180478 Transcript_104676/m.180478 type:complete len:85 (+) Transcript_104676:1520-1774(+)